MPGLGRRAAGWGKKRVRLPTIRAAAPTVAAVGRQARAGLDQLELEFTSDRMCRLHQRIKLYPIVLRVQ